MTALFGSKVSMPTLAVSPEAGQAHTCAGNRNVHAQASDGWDKNARNRSKTRTDQMSINSRVETCIVVYSITDCQEHFIIAFINQAKLIKGGRSATGKGHGALLRGVVMFSVLT